MIKKKILWSKYKTEINYNSQNELWESKCITRIEISIKANNTAIIIYLIIYLFYQSNTNIAFKI